MCISAAAEKDYPALFPRIPSPPGVFGQDDTVRPTVPPVLTKRDTWSPRFYSDCTATTFARLYLRR